MSDRSRPPALTPPWGHRDARYESELRDNTGLLKFTPERSSKLLFLYMCAQKGGLEITTAHSFLGLMYSKAFLKGSLGFMICDTYVSNNFRQFGRLASRFVRHFFLLFAYLLEVLGVYTALSTSLGYIFGLALESL